MNNINNLKPLQWEITPETDESAEFHIAHVIHGFYMCYMTWGGVRVEFVNSNNKSIVKLFDIKHGTIQNAKIRAEMHWAQFCIDFLNGYFK